MELTSDQFEVLAWLIRGSGSSKKAAEMVMVAGMRPCDAARKLDVSANLVSVALGKYRRAAKEIRRVFAK